LKPAGNKGSNGQVCIWTTSIAVGECWKQARKRRHKCATDTRDISCPSNPLFQTQCTRHKPTPPAAVDRMASRKANKRFCEKKNRCKEGSHWRGACPGCDTRRSNNSLVRGVVGGRSLHAVAHTRAQATQKRGVNDRRELELPHSAVSTSFEEKTRHTTTRPRNRSREIS